jgi:hypothetical protein
MSDPSFISHRIYATWGPIDIVRVFNVRLVVAPWLWWWFSAASDCWHHHPTIEGRPGLFCFGVSLPGVVLASFPNPFATCIHRIFRVEEPPTFFGFCSLRRRRHLLRSPHPCPRSEPRVIPEGLLCKLPLCRCYSRPCVAFPQYRLWSLPTRLAGRLDLPDALFPDSQRFQEGNRHGQTRSRNPGDDD